MEWGLKDVVRNKMFEALGQAWFSLFETCNEVVMRLGVGCTPARNEESVKSCVLGSLFQGFSSRYLSTGSQSCDTTRSFRISLSL